MPTIEKQERLRQEALRRARASLVAMSALSADSAEMVDANGRPQGFDYVVVVANLVADLAAELDTIS